MALFETDVNISAMGVHRPFRLWIAILSCIPILIFLSHQLYLNRIPLYAALLVILLVGFLLTFARMKYGKSGMPLVELNSADLVIYLPGDSRGHVRFAKSELREIQIYGGSNNRKYRFLRNDGTFVDLTPFYSVKVEHAVNQFLVTKLPPNIGVKICAPQTLFEQARGDIS